MNIYIQIWRLALGLELKVGYVQKKKAPPASEPTPAPKPRGPVGFTRTPPPSNPERTGGTQHGLG